jgi:polyhydroxybutyrate depolymerase
MPLPARHLALVLLPLALLPACGTASRLVCEEQLPNATGELSCAFEAFPDREVDLFVPTSADDGSAIPLVFFLHGGGGTKAGARSATCQDGDTDHPSCIQNVGEAEGFITLIPEGTRNAVVGRSWNGGGGVGDWACVGGEACAQGVDDVAFFDGMITALIASGRVDARRIYVTGISQGAAMSYRLACNLGDRIAAVAPVAGGYQSLANDETCVGATSVLHMHGDADPIWPPEGGASEAADGLLGVSVDQGLVGDKTFTGWTTFLDCDTEPTIAAFDDRVDDGVTHELTTWTDCREGAEVQLLMSLGGGHTWPGGRQYLSEDQIGPVTLDFSGSQVAWDFFERFSLPTAE